MGIFSKRECRIVESVHASKMVKIITLEAADGGVFEFRPGMFASISFIHDGIPYGPKPFSVASSPLDRKKLEFCVRKSGDTTTAMFRLEPGNPVTILGPYGNFTLEEPMSKHVVLIAGGTGIAPLMSMLRYAITKRFKTKIVLLFSAQTQHDILYRDELEHIADEHDNFSLIVTLTREPQDSDWSGPRGRLDEELLKDVIPDRHHADCYICGPQGFVASVTDLLADIGVVEEHVHKEKW